MVQAVHRHPEDGTAFERQGAAQREEVLEQYGDPVRPVGVQAVVAHADAQAGGYAIGDYGHGEGSPTEHKQGGNGPDMKEHKDQGGEPVQALALVF